MSNSTTFNCSIYAHILFKTDPSFRANFNEVGQFFYLTTGCGPTQVYIQDGAILLQYENETDANSALMNNDMIFTGDTHFMTITSPPSSEIIQNFLSSKTENTTSSNVTDYVKHLAKTQVENCSCCSHKTD